jgi:hypothetical protein
MMQIATVSVTPTHIYATDAAAEANALCSAARCLGRARTEEVVEHLQCRWTLKVHGR